MWWLGLSGLLINYVVDCKRNDFASSMFCVVEKKTKKVGRSESLIVNTVHAALQYNNTRRVAGTC